MACQVFIEKLQPLRLLDNAGSRTSNVGNELSFYLYISDLLATISVSRDKRARSARVWHQ